jgi:WD40 repeat protein
MKRLVIPRGGDILLASSRQNQISVWDIATASRRFTLDGQPVGIDRNGGVLLYQLEDGTKGCDLSGGAEIPISQLDADLFEPSQRCVVRGQRFRMRLEIDDVFHQLPLRVVMITQDSRYFPSLDSWALSPDNTSLVATLSGEVSGEEWASGVCMDLETGQRRFKFSVNRFQRIPPICFSPEHKLLMIGDNSCHLSIFNLETGQPVREIYIGGFGMVSAISPANPALAAVNAWEPVLGAGNSPFSVHLLDLQHLQGERMLRARMVAVIHAPQSVEELEFAPDGRSLAVLLVDGTILIWDLVADQVKEWNSR